MVLKVPPATPGLLPLRKRPCCRYCGKPMRPTYETREEISVTEIDKMLPIPNTDSKALHLVRATERRSISVAVRVLYYGFDAAQLFCSLRCGYRYAVQSIRG